MDKARPKQQPVAFDPPTAGELKIAREAMLSYVSRGVPPQIAARAAGVPEDWDEDEAFYSVVERAEAIFIANTVIQINQATPGNNTLSVFFLKARAGQSDKEGADFPQKLIFAPETVDGTKPPPEAETPA